MKNKNWAKVIHETYELLFKASEPSVDFNDLLANATINEDGKKVIKYWDYEIDEKVMKDILKSQMIKYKMNKFDMTSFGIHMYLGASPKTKYREYLAKHFDPEFLKNV